MEGDVVGCAAAITGLTGTPNQRFCYNSRNAVALRELQMAF